MLVPKAAPGLVLPLTAMHAARRDAVSSRDIPGWWRLMRTGLEEKSMPKACTTLLCDSLWIRHQTSSKTDWGLLHFLSPCAVVSELRAAWVLIQSQLRRSHQGALLHPRDMLLPPEAVCCLQKGVCSSGGFTACCVSRIRQIFYSVQSKEIEEWYPTKFLVLHC